MLKDSNARRTSSQGPSPLLTAAQGLSESLALAAPVHDDIGGLTDETVETLRRSGLTGLLVPRDLGGQEASLLEALDVLETVSRSDAATGWVLMATQAATAAAAAYLPPDGAARVFSGQVPIIAGQGAPNGKAIKRPGGYQLHGRWNYGSGVKHADFFHSGAIVIENGAARRLPNGEPERRIFIVPTKAGKLESNWDVLGLRGTGSIDYSLDDVFVPEQLTHSPSAQSIQRGRVYGIGMIGMTSLGHTAWALGVGRRALDEAKAVAAGKTVGSGLNLQNSEEFQRSFADVSARYLAGRALVYDTWREIERAADRGTLLTQRQITTMRLALNHATSAAVEAAEFAYKAAGGVGLRQGAVQRCFRDAYSGAQHIMVSSSVSRDCGRELLGLAGDLTWTARGLA